MCCAGTNLRSLKNLRIRQYKNVLLTPYTNLRGVWPLLLAQPKVVAILLQCRISIRISVGINFG